MSVLLEPSLLISKGRVSVSGPPVAFMREFARRFHVLPIDADIAILATQLPLPQGDPFDRIFVATAQLHGLPLVTRDASIRDSGLIETIW